MKKLQILCFLFIPFCTSAQENAKDILSKMSANFKTHQSLSYNADLRIKYFDRQDTSYADGTVHMMRVEHDTIWGGMIWAGEGKKYETYTFYDLNRHYVVQNTIHRMVIDKARKGNTGLSMLYTYLLEIPFLQDKKLRNDATEKLTLQPETVISGKPCYVLGISRFKGNSQVADETWYITKADFFPIMIKKSETSGQASILIINSYEYDKVGPKQFSPDQVPSNYRIENREQDLPKNTQPAIRPREEWPLPGSRRR